MPGHWPVGHLHAVVAQAAGKLWDPRTAPVSMCKLLVERLDFSAVSHVVDVWPAAAPGTAATLYRALPHARPAVVTRPWQPGAFRALTPTPQVAVCHAPDSVMDLPFALAAMVCTHAVCAFLPLTYLTHGPQARAKFLKTLFLEQRLLILLEPLPTPGQVQWAWVCTFRSVAVRQSMLRVAFCASLTQTTDGVMALAGVAADDVDVKH